jgi:transposase-like protein
MVEKQGVEGVVREMKRRTRRKYSSEEKIRIVLEGLRGEVSIAELCRKEGMRGEPVLHVEQGLPGSREEASSR